MRKDLTNKILEAYRTDEPSLRTTFTLPKYLLVAVDAQRKALAKRYNVKVTRDQLIAVALTEALS